MERYRRWLRVPIAAALLVACGAALLVACGDDGFAPLAAGSSTTQPGVSTTASPAGSTTGVSTANQTSPPSTGSGAGTPTTAATGSGATGTTTAGSGGTTPPTTAAQTTSGGGSARKITAGDLVAQRASLVGEQVTVEGRVLFLLSCPPGGSGCTASGYLADRSTDALPPSASAAQAEAMLLAQGQSAVGCGGVTSLANLECGGFQHSGEYRVTGTVSRLSSVVVLDVGAKQRL